MGRAFAQLGFEVVSLDSDPEAGATHTCNVLDFYYMHYPPGHFDVVWASPPCTHYSRARTTGGPRDLEGSDRLVAKTLEIIAYFKPTCWAFENVGSGLLPKREIVQGLHCSYLTYCKYADTDFPKYRKLTAIWHNLPWTPIPVCCRASRCAHIVDGRHPVSAQRGPTRNHSPQERQVQPPHPLQHAAAPLPGDCERMSADVSGYTARRSAARSGTTRPLGRCGP